MIAILTHKDGVLLPVKARPGARADALVDEHAGVLRVRVTAPPEPLPASILTSSFASLK